MSLQSVFSNNISVCCFVRDDVSNTFVLSKRAQRRMAMENRKVRSGITKVVRKKADNGSGEP